MDHCPHCGGALQDVPKDNCKFCGEPYVRARKWSEFCKPICRSRYHYAKRMKKQKEMRGEQG